VVTKKKKYTLYYTKYAPSLVFFFLTKQYLYQHSKGVRDIFTIFEDKDLVAVIFLSFNAMFFLSFVKSR